MKFWKIFGASLLATVVVIGLSVVYLTVKVSSAFGSFNEQFEAKEIKVDDNSILHLKLNEPIGERTFAQLDQQTFSITSKLGLDAIRSGLKKAKDDEKIKGVYLDVSGINAGMASVEEIRNMLIDFKKSNKFLIAYSESYSMGSYYVASVADEVYLYPEGMMDFRGLGTELMFFKGALDKWNVDMQIIRGSNNKFKSAVEPFLYDKMSDANRKQMEVLLGSMWDHMRSGIEKERGISSEKLNLIADSVLAATAQDAKDLKMVDNLMYKDEIIALLQTKVKVESAEDMNIVPFTKYAKKANKITPRQWRKANVAVVYATGAIESGNGNIEVIGSESISKAIREARLDEDVKAIVLRVNSPGGSALASDVIWREVALARETKPVVVSMGDYAASGGYYISCAADKIYAQPNTLTGSIGVFGVIPSIENMLNEHVGITLDRVQTNAHSVLTITKPLSDEEKKVIQEGVDEIYGLFKRRVADGRPLLDVAMVDSIGQGRVWSGTDAIEIGLVDELGGLNDAIAYAAEKAEIAEDEIQVAGYPKMGDNDLTELLEALEGMDNKEEEKPTLSNEILRNLKMIDELAKMEGIQARLPFEIVIK